MRLSTQITVPVLALALLAGPSPLSVEYAIEAASEAIPSQTRTTAPSAGSTSAARTDVPSLVLSGIGVVGGSPDLRERAETAVQHFLGAGLDLRGVVIVFHSDTDGCGGHDGVYRPATHHVDICNTNRLIIIHELAHAWDAANLDDEMRSRFMELRRIERWNDASDPWKQRGIEDLAETVVWGLGRLEDCPGTPSDPDRAQAFRLITGIELDTSTDESCDEFDGAPTSHAAELRSFDAVSTGPLSSTGDGLTR